MQLGESNKKYPSATLGIAPLTLGNERCGKLGYWIWHEISVMLIVQLVCRGKVRASGVVRIVGVPSSANCRYINYVEDAYI